MNLLPVTYKKNIIEENRYKKLMAACAIIFLFIILIVSVQLLQIIEMNAERLSISQRLDDEKYILSEEFYRNYSALQTREEELTKALDVSSYNEINTEEAAAVSNNILPAAKNILSFLLEELSGDNGCFFEELNITSGTIYLSGRAEQKEDILNFFEKLPQGLGVAFLENLEKREDGGFGFTFYWETEAS